MGLGRYLAAGLAVFAMSSAAQAGPILCNAVDLGTIGAFANNGSFGQSVNNYGQVVGHSNISTASAGALHAFLWSNGAMHDLGVLGTGT